jgi:hypothetical protein
VIVRERLEQITQAYSRPEDPESRQLVHGASMIYSDDFVNHLAAEYDPAEGCSSLYKAIAEHVQEQVIDAHSEEGICGKKLVFALERPEGAEPTIVFDVR